MKSVAQHEVGVAGSPRVRSLGVGGHVKVPGLLPLLSEEELVRDASGHIQRGQVSG